MHTKRSTLMAAALTLTFATATLVAAGGGGQSGQSTQTGQPTQTGSQGQTQTPTQPPAGQRDDSAARAELAQAKQALIELIALPETSKLGADSRTAVNQVITSFNSLVTAESNWYDRYQDLQRSLTPILGPDPSDPAAAASNATSGATGTSGTSGSAGTSGSTGTSGSSTGASGTTPPAPALTLPDTVKEKLVQFRQHMQGFARAAGAQDASQSGAPTAGQPPFADAMQPHVDAIADLLQQALGGQLASSGTSGASGSNTGTTGSSGTAASGSPVTSASGTVTVDRATLLQMQAHVQKIREIARAKGIR